MKTSSNRTRILGVDPGYERVGIAILEKGGARDALLHSECFRTKAVLPMPERLNLIGKRIAEIISHYKPSVLAIETLFFNENQKTAMGVSEARGVIIYEASKNKLEVKEFTPLQIKMGITGYGRADKKQIQKMLSLLVEITKKPQDDEFDAIACALNYSAPKRG